MLPKETAELDIKKEELAFFSNACWDEVRRVAADDVKILRTHFRDLSSIICSFIN